MGYRQQILYSEKNLVGKYAGGLLGYKAFQVNGKDTMLGNVRTCVCRSIEGWSLLEWGHSFMPRTPLPANHLIIFWRIHKRSSYNVYIYISG